MNAVWGEDDCLTEVLGDFARPAWLAVPTSTQAFANFLNIYGDDLTAAAEQFAEVYAKDHRRLPNHCAWQPGDVVAGCTEEYRFAIAKVHDSYLPMIRTDYGYQTAHFTGIYGAWRPAA